jgi:hypothetical protein
MSHELHAIDDGRYLDNNLVDDSYVILTEAEVDATFNKDWREHVHDPDSPYTTEDAEELARRSK